jgi:hypothetical protein
MTVPFSNGGQALFRRSLDVLAEQADGEYEAQKSLWQSGHITDQQHAAAVDTLIEKADRLQAMWAQWLRGEAA